MLIPKQKKSRTAKGNRFLISVSVTGSAGPIRFVVNEDDVVAGVIDTVLKSYARQGRLPVLGSRLDNFILYSRIDGSEAMVPWTTIGSAGVRDFILCKKPQTDDATVKEAPPAARTRRPAGSKIWRAWFSKYRTPKISSH